MMAKDSQPVEFLEIALSAVTLAFGGVVAWVGKLHIDMGKLKDDVDALERTVMSREELEGKLKDYKEESWRAHEAAQKVMTDHMDQRFDLLHNAVIRVEDRINHRS